MIGFLLLILAWIFIPILTVINVIIVASKSSSRGWFKTLGKYFKNTARNLDIFLADEFRTLWNAVLITKNGVRFEGDGKTISSYLGANQQRRTLTLFGKVASNICDFFEENHCYFAYINEFIEEF